MELGGAEIARAAQRLGLAAAPYLASSAHWAKRYLKLGSADTLNLYDVGALAHASLADAMAEVPHGALEVTRRAAGQGPGPPAPDRRPPGAPRRVRRAGRRDRVRRQQPQLRPGRQRGALRAAHRQPPLPRLRHPGAHLAARRQPVGRQRDGGHRLVVPAMHAAPGRQPRRRARPRRGGQRTQRRRQLRGRAGRLPGRDAALLAAPLRRLRRAGQPVRRRRARVADRRARARHDRRRDPRRRGPAQPRRDREPK